MPSSACDGAATVMSASESKIFRIESLRACRRYYYDARRAAMQKRGRDDAPCYDAAVPASAALTTALGQLLVLDGRTMPDSPDREALLDYVGESRWLRFGLGVAPGE